MGWGMSDDDIRAGKGRAAVGYGGGWKIAHRETEPGSDQPHHITWLPSGHGPCEGQFTVALVACPFDNYELDKQLAQAVADTIQRFIWEASRRHRPIKTKGWRPALERAAPPR